ncbi:MAG: GNAT family N-acetyltransferase [Desulfobacterium sp.]|nr:GNAT family N-acetyltransferase [Desulfobacterium sp.]
MIRLVSHIDAEELFKLVDENRAYLRRWLPWLDHNKTLDDTREFIKTSLRDYAEQGSMIHVVEDAGRVCGICGFDSINRTIKAGFIGYWISQQSQGKGLITMACGALETLGFDRLGLHKLEIHIAQENVSSRAVAERLNYQNTGTILDAEWLYDHYVNHVIYCKLNPEGAS